MNYTFEPFPENYPDSRDKGTIGFPDKDYVNYQCECGSEVFNVYSRGPYITAAKCIKCGNDREVHTG